MRKLPALISAAALCWGPTTQAEGSTVFGPGEQSTFKVRYLGMPAGSTQITVGAQTHQWGVDVWPIVALARTESVFSLFPVRDRFITYWDPQSGRCIGSDLLAEENRKRRRERVVLHHEEKTAEVFKQEEGGAEKRDTHSVATGSMDMAAAVFALRNQPLAVGKTFELPVFTGARSFTLRAKVIGEQTLETELGPKKVFAVDVTTDFVGKVKAKQDMRAYFTEDPLHVLVRVEAELALGTIQANLVEYRQGRSLAALSKLRP